MSDNSWAYDIGTVVFSIVKTKAKPKLESKYPTIYFTSNGKKLSDAIFPTVYIHRMAAAERGADLEGLSINATLETFQVDVFTNTNQSDVGRIMSVVADVFKEMRFKVVALPEFNEGDTYRSTARFQRIIGANDSLT